MATNASRTMLTTRELAQATAGGDDYIRTKSNEVRGLALRLDLNPRAPEVIAFGDGPRIVARAKLLLDSQAVVPAYVKRAVDAWEYVGHFRAVAIRTDEHTIRIHAGNRPDKIFGVLFLEAAGQQSS